jgi:hypothetical protein
MDDSRWQQLITTIKGDDIEAMVLASEVLYRRPMVRMCRDYWNFWKMRILLFERPLHGR